MGLLIGLQKKSNFIAWKWHQSRTGCRPKTMDLRILYGMMAETILVTHFAFIAFVVFGFILTVCGGFRDWPWVRNPWFRMIHLTVIWVIVAQVWLGVVCPFTTLEMSLRALAGQATYDGTFIAHWLRKLVYFHQLPHAFFIASYTALGLVAVTCWVAIRPRPFRVRGMQSDGDPPR